MTHIDFRNRVLLGVCAVAATLAFAPASTAHGAGAGMSMGARGGGMAMQPPFAGPHPFDPSGHLGGPLPGRPGAPVSPAPPRVKPTPVTAPQLDSPAASANSSTSASGDVDTRSHAPFHYPNAGGGKVPGETSGDANLSPSAPKLDPPPK